MRKVLLFLNAGVVLLVLLAAVAFRLYSLFHSWGLEYQGKLVERAVSEANPALCEEARSHIKPIVDSEYLMSKREAANDCYYEYAIEKLNLNACYKISTDVPPEREGYPNYLIVYCIYIVHMGLEDLSAQDCAEMQQYGSWLDFTCEEEVGRRLGFFDMTGTGPFVLEPGPKVRLQLKPVETLDGIASVKSITLHFLLNTNVRLHILLYEYEGLPWPQVLMGHWYEEDPIELHEGINDFEVGLSPAEFMSAEGRIDIELWSAENHPVQVLDMSATLDRK